jgi:uncharacterized membrane protein
LQPPSALTTAARALDAIGDYPRVLIGSLILILCGIAARLVGLDHLLVWHDEVYSLARIFGYSQEQLHTTLFSGRTLYPNDLLSFQYPMACHGWADTLRALAEHPEHAPLYYLLGRLASTLAVSPVTALRGVSAVAGVLLIPAAWWLMRELFGRGRVPWMAAVLVACSPLQLLYAQEGRQYALWMLLYVAASAALAAAIRRGTLPAWGLYGLLMTLGLYSHLLFLLIIPVHAVYGLHRILTRDAVGSSTAVVARSWVKCTGLALLAFAPWLWVLATGWDLLGQNTSWMMRPAALGDIFLAWGRHLTEVFVDLSPGAQPIWLFLLVPLGLMTLHFLWRAPRSGMWLLTLSLFGFVGLALGPDLLLGGGRSLEVRYALPALLALQLMTAWSLGTILGAAPGTGQRRLAGGLFALLAALGLLSQLAIARAESWSTKGLSAQNAAVARLANAGQRPLIVASDGDISVGELISLAHHLKPAARIWGEPAGGMGAIPGDADVLIALAPSDRLSAELGRLGTLKPIPGTWQWLALIPSQPPRTPAPDRVIPGTP